MIALPRWKPYQCFFPGSRGTEPGRAASFASRSLPSSNSTYLSFSEFLAVQVPSHADPAYVAYQPGEPAVDSQGALWRANVKKRPNADMPIRLWTVRQVTFSIGEHEPVKASVQINGDVGEMTDWDEWWPGTELNRRRQPFQGCALPPELPGHFVRMSAWVPEMRIAEHAQRLGTSTAGRWNPDCVRNRRDYNSRIAFLSTWRSRTSSDPAIRFSAQF